MSKHGSQTDVVPCQKRPKIGIFITLSWTLFSHLCLFYRQNWRLLYASIYKPRFWQGGMECIVGNPTHNMYLFKDLYALNQLTIDQYLGGASREGGKGGGRKRKGRTLQGELLKYWSYIMMRYTGTILYYIWILNVCFYTFIGIEYLMNVIWSLSRNVDLRPYTIFQMDRIYTLKLAHNCRQKWIWNYSHYVYLLLYLSISSNCFSHICEIHILK